MSDPLSIAASVIAVTTLGLQSTKFIYEALSGLCKSSQEFVDAGDSLQALLRILEHIRRLTQSSPFAVLVPNGSSTASNSDDEPFLKELHITVKRCSDELEAIVPKVQKWEAKKRSTNKIAFAVKWHVRSNDLKKIHELVSRQIQLLNIQLNFAGVAQLTNHSERSRISSTKHGGQLTDLSTRLSAKIKQSASSVTEHVSKSLEQTYVTLSSNHDDLTETIKRTSVIQQDRFQDLVKTMEQSITTSFNESQARTLSEILELRRQLDNTNNANNANEYSDSDELQQRIQACVDRLYELRDSGNCNLDIDSSDAQLIQEDLVIILKSLLHEISFPKPQGADRKRKRALKCEGRESSEPEGSIEEMRVTKRMRGILDSSQTVQFRDCNWQNDCVLAGRKIQSHNRSWETSSGTMSIMAAVIEPTTPERNAGYVTTSITQAFAGSLTLMPKTAKRKMKLRVFFAQHVSRNGAFSFSPTLSFHAIVPENSPVIELVRNGDLDGLKRLVQDGLASLTDCDTWGNSLLFVRKLSDCVALANTTKHAIRATTHRGVKCYPQICEYLVSKGADVNGFELHGRNDREMITLLSYSILNQAENDSDYYSNIIDCMKLFLAAGADSSLSCAGGSSGYDRCPLVDSVYTYDMDILRVVLDHGRPLLDIEARDMFGNTALLVALRSAALNLSSLQNDSVEISFQQAHLLIDRGASCQVNDTEGNNCLHILLRKSLTSEYKLKFHPHQLLTNLLVRILKAGADPCALNDSGRTPSHFATWRQSDCESAWRDALSQCGFSPQDVYEKSGLKWRPILPMTPEIELQTYFVYIRDTYHRTSATVKRLRRSEVRQWTPDKIQELMVEVIQSGVDFFRPVSPYGKTIPQLARIHHADLQFIDALRTCGFDPQEVFAKSDIQWDEAFVEERRETDRGRVEDVICRVCYKISKAIRKERGRFYNSQEVAELLEDSEEEEYDEESDDDEADSEDNNDNEDDHELEDEDDSEDAGTKDELDEGLAITFQEGSQILQQPDSHEYAENWSNRNEQNHTQTPALLTETWPDFATAQNPQHHSSQRVWMTTNPVYENHWGQDSLPIHNNYPGKLMLQPWNNVPMTAGSAEQGGVSYGAHAPGSVDFINESEVWGDVEMS